MKKICVYAICKNEEKHIDRWINSLKEADKIVVLDTGSTDNTVKKLQSYSPLVEVHQQEINPWRFDVARNKSMKYIPEDTDICVISDCDQVFRSGWAAILRQRFEEGYEEVYGPIIDYDEQGNEEKRFLSRNVHSYDLNWKWIRPVHEGIEYQGDHIPKYIIDDNFIIEHHPDRTKSRNQYLEILEREYLENSTDPYCAIYYGCELSFHNQDKQALEVFLRAINECDFSQHLEIGYQINLNIALYYLEDIADYEKALTYALNAKNFNINTRRLYITIAKIYYQLGQYKQALQEIINALESVPEDNQSWTEDREWFDQNIINNFIYEIKSHLNQVIVYTICKNEENNILNWYNNIKYADEIIVIDTGSTDNSLQILSDLSIHTDTFIQEDFNFSIARNKALEYARTFERDKNTIYVCLDLDEYLEPLGILKILIQWDNNHNKMGLNNKGILINKIHSADKEWHWERKVHEKLCHSNIKFIDSNITYMHIQNPNKQRNYYEMLQEEIEEEKNNPQILTFVYAAWEALLHDDYKKCDEYAKKALDLLYQEKELNYELIIGCYIYIIQCNINQEYTLQVINNIEKIINNNLFPDFRRLRYLLGNFYSSFDIIKSKKEYAIGRKILTPINSWNDNPDLYKNKICIYTICKNEKQFVDRWLNSMKEADSIVVLDTGSTDGTYEYLIEQQNQYPQLIVKQQIINPWRFDVARNESMKYIPGDCNILMSTDLDEILTEGWANEIRNSWIEGLHQRGIYMYTWQHLNDGNDGRTFIYDKIHSWDWEWKAPVHEYLYHSIEHRQNYEGQEVLDLTQNDKVHLHHYPDWEKSRSNYLPLLELREKEFPNDYYGLIYLAREYMFHDMYEKSIEKFNYIIDNFKNQCDTIELCSCYCFIGDNYFALQNYNEAIIAYQRAITVDSTYRESYIALGKTYFQIQNYDLAKYYVKLGIQNSYRHYTWLEENESWSWGPWDLLTLICFYKGDKIDALAYAIKALSYEPTNERLKENLELCIQLSNDTELI